MPLVPGNGGLECLYTRVRFEGSRLEQFSRHVKIQHYLQNRARRHGLTCP